MKSVSVHIVTYNSVEDITSCLEAVFQQSYAIERIIVIDNDSKDGTRQALESYKDRGVEVILNSHNNGFAGGHNQAIRMTHTDYCLILNPDVQLHPDYVYHLVQFMEDHPDQATGSLTGKLLSTANPDIVDSCGLRFNKARRAFDLGNGEPASQWTQAGEVFGVSGAAAFYSRELINSISIDGEFFDESFFAYKEDVDVAWRSQLLGFTSYYVPAAWAYHHRGWKTGGRSSQPLFVRRLSYINRYRMIYKNDSWSSLIRHLPHLLIYEGASHAYLLLRERELLGAWRTFRQDEQRLKRWKQCIQTGKKLKNCRNFRRFFNKKIIF